MPSKHIIVRHIFVYVKMEKVATRENENTNWQLFIQETDSALRNKWYSVIRWIPSQINIVTV